MCMCLVTQSCLTLWTSGTVAHQSPLFMGILQARMNTGASCHAFLQGIFPTQGLNPGLLHCRQILYTLSHQYNSVQLLSHVRLFATPWSAACQASLSITNSRSSLRLTSIESVMPSSHLILCRPFLLLPPIPPCLLISCLSEGIFNKGLSHSPVGNSVPGTLV